MFTVLYFLMIYLHFTVEINRSNAKDVMFGILLKIIYTLGTTLP